MTTLSELDDGARQLKLIRSGRSSARYSPSITLRRSGKIIVIRSGPPTRASTSTSAMPAGQMNSASVSSSIHAS